MPFAGSDRHQCAATNRVDRRMMIFGAAQKRDFDEAGARVSWLDVRKQWANLRPSPVRSHDEVGLDHGFVREGHRVPAAIGRDGRDFAIPLDCLRRKRAEQHIPKLTPIHFWTGRGVATEYVEQQASIFVDDPLGILAGAGQRHERVEQARVLEGVLAALLMDVEEIPLRSHRGRRFGLIDRRGEATQMQNAR